MASIRDRALTLVLMETFLLFLVGQLFTGLAEYNDQQTQHDGTAPTISRVRATRREVVSSKQEYPLRVRT